MGAAVALSGNLAETGASRAAHADRERGKVLASPVFQSCFLAQGLCYSILLVFNIVGPFMVQTTLHKPPTFFGYLASASD